MYTWRRPFKASVSPAFLAAAGVVSILAPLSSYNSWPFPLLSLLREVFFFVPERNFAWPFSRRVEQTWAVACRLSRKKASNFGPKASLEMLFEPIVLLTHCY